MADEQQSLKHFLFEAKSRADVILAAEHIGADVKAVIKDLLLIGNNYETTMQQAAGQSADARMLKKKLDQSKSGSKDIELKLASAKALVFKIVDEIKIVNSETATILKSLAADPQNPIHQGATKIKAATQRMIDIIVQTKY